MDELNILKKDWDRNNEYPKLTYNEIYAIILKKSSSIVKWLFIICILEFAFWIGISLVFNGSSLSAEIQDLNLDAVLMPISIISYLVLFYFFYLFYKNYKNISVTDNSITLMKNIIKTRKTVKHYVIFNLISIIIAVIIGSYYALNHAPDLVAKIELASNNNEIFKFYTVFIIGILVTLIIAIAILLLFYWLVYGLLLKRLNMNYKELKKFEIKGFT